MATPAKPAAKAHGHDHHGHEHHDHDGHDHKHDAKPGLLSRLFGKR